MIRNYNELLICIHNAEKKILTLSVEKQVALLDLQFKKARAILVQQQQLQLRITEYMSWYEQKIGTCYLENKIYGHKLKDLKKLHQSRDNVAYFIYCLQKLTDQYHELLKDAVFFQKADKINDVKAIEVKIKKTIHQMEQLFSEFRRIMLLPNFNFDRNQIAQYNSLTRFLTIHYSSTVQKLECELQAKIQVLKLLHIICNYRLFKTTKKEIQHIKNKIKALNAANKNLIFIDQIKWDFTVI